MPLLRNLMSYTKASIISVCFVFLTLCSSSVVGQTSPQKPQADTTAPSTPEVKSADQWVDVGTKAYQAKQYKEALAAFQKAQSINNSNDLNYNIGRVYEALNQPEKALEAYGKFALSPDANVDARADALKRMNILKQIIAARETKKTEPVKPQKPVVVQKPVKAPKQSTSSGPHPMSWVLLGTGTLAVGIGSYFAIQANSAQSLAESKCQTQGDSLLCPQTTQANWDDMKQNALIADIAFATGGALLIGSLITFIVSSGDDTPAQVQLTPVMTPSSASLQLQTSF